MKKLTVAIPCKLQINASTIMSIFNSCLNSIGGYSVSIRILAGKSNIIHARSILLSEWYDIADDDDLFLFLDADQTFTVEDIQALINLNSDVACGTYVNSAGIPNCFPKDRKTFFQNKSNELWYGATGFMLIRRSILHQVIEYIKKDHKSDNVRYWISQKEQSIIPFFQTRIIDSELNPGTIKEWLGEDYSFCWLVRHSGGTIRGHLSTTIGHEVAQLKFYQPGSENLNLILNNNPPLKNSTNTLKNSTNTLKNSTNTLKNSTNTLKKSTNTLINKTNNQKQVKVWENKTIVYYTGHSRVKWSPNSSGLGGSENAVVQLAHYWCQNGFNVTVFGTVDPGMYDGVNYVSFQDFNINDVFDHLILWRGFGLQILSQVKAKYIYVDLHDNTQKELLPSNLFNKISRVMFKSMYHRKLFNYVPDQLCAVIPNGVETHIIDMVTNTKRQPFRLIYTSSYDRGLLYMLKWGWPYIKRYIPQAEFHIFYGMELVPDSYKQHLIPLLNQPGVTDHGKISHEELAKEFKKSTIHYYLTSCPYTEIDCISVKESAYAGCIPILSTLAVFPERVGVHIEGDPKNEETQIKAAQYIIKLLESPEIVDNYRKKISSEIYNQTSGWDEISNAWLKMFKM